MTKKKTPKVQIFKLEERVLFDGAAAAEIVAAVNNSANQQADQDADSDQDQEEKLIQNTIQNAGPVDTPAPEANVQNEGEGLPQADAAAQDPAEILINGNPDFTQITDPAADFSAQVDNNIDADTDLSVAPQTPSELVILDPEAADQFDSHDLEGKTVLVLDPDSDAADQINDWLDEHDDQSFDSVRIVSADDADDADGDANDSFLLDADEIDQLQDRLGADADIESISASEFDSELAAENSDMIIFPDHQSQITVDADADADILPDALEQDAGAGRHELVIVNSTTADLDNVLDQLGDSREILVIDSTADAFDQISDYLDNSDTAYDAVHILTHGNDQGFYLGSQKVVAADQMGIFDGHMAENADFMLYGCDLASTEYGQAFVQSIADLTGCDVAASADTTGAASLNGDWALEYNSGAIETASISLDSSWNHQLAVVTIGSGGTYADLLAYYTAGITDSDVAEYQNDMADTSMSAASFEIAAGEGITISANGFDVSITSAFDVQNGSLIFSGVGVIGDVTVAAGSTLTLQTDGVSNASIEGTATINGTLNVNADAEVTTTQLKTGSTLNYSNGVTLTGDVDSEIDLTLTGASNLLIDGTLTMENGATLDLQTDATIDMIDLQDGSTLNYAAAITLDGGIDFHSGAKIYAEGAPDPGAGIFILDATPNLSITGTLTMETGTELHLNTDAEIGTIDLLSGSTLNYTDGTTLTGGIDFHSGAKIYAEGAADPGASIFAPDAAPNLTIDGTLTMETGTTLALNADAAIRTIVFQDGSDFTYTNGVTLNGSIDSSIVLTFNQGEFTISPFDNLTPTSDINLRAGAMDVAANSTLNLYNTAIVAHSAQAITNAGTVNFHEANTITFPDTVSSIYSGVLNTGTVNIVKDNLDSAASLSVDFSAVDTTFQKNGLLNNGANAVVNITEGSLTVNSSNNTSQAVYAVNNTLGQTSGNGGVVVSQESTATLTTSGTKSAAIFNAQDQLVTIGTKGDVDGSRIVLIGNNTSENYAVYNNGTAKIYNSFIVATTGNKSIGLFNSTSGTMIFNVSEAPNEYVTAADIDAAASAYVLTYGVSGARYSVYNLGKFTGKTSDAHENDTVYSGTYGDVTLTAVPLLLFNGEFHTQGKSSGTDVETTLSHVVVLGELTSTQTASITLSNVYFSSDINNTGSTVNITGEFRSPEQFTFDHNGTKKESGSYIAGVHTITNDLLQLGSSGNIYFDNVAFYENQNYYFNNRAGEMTVYNFTGLSNVDHPVTINNRGQFSMDADTSSETPYALFVSYNGSYTDDGVNNIGILNTNTNDYDKYVGGYPVINEMVLSDLDIVNAVAGLTVGVTNYGGNLTINRGSVQATYSGIDSLFRCTASTGTDTKVYIRIPITQLNDVTRISGARASIRNAGYLTLNGEHVGAGDEVGTLLTNALEGISSSWTGEYIAVWNSSPEYAVARHYYVANSTAHDRYGWKIANAFQSYSETYSVTGASLNVPEFKFFTAVGKEATLITLNGVPTSDNYNKSGTKTVESVVHNYYGWGDIAYDPFNATYSSTTSVSRSYTVAAKGDVSNIKLQSAAGTADTIAFRNWGELTVSGINSSADYRFKGFTVSIDQGRSDDISGNSAFIPKGDYTIGFELDSAASIRMMAGDGQFNDLTLRGVQNQDGTYSGGMKATSEYVVYRNQSLSLENFKVTADDNAFVVHGNLYVYNGQLNDATGEYTGPSDAYIAAGGTAVEVGAGGFFFMINGAIKDANIGIDILSTGGTAAVINTTLYNNNIGVRSGYANNSSVYVVNSTIVSGKGGSYGIQQNAGRANITNSVILVSGGNSVSGSYTLSGANIIGTADDTMTKLNEVFGVNNFNDLVFVDQYQGITLVAGSTALSAKGSTVKYTLTTGTNPSISFGSGVTITMDKAGNARGTAIGSYLGTGSQPIINPVFVTTLKDQGADPDEDEYSLRYMIDYLLSAGNTDASYQVLFDWDKLIAEAGGANNLTITLSDAAGYGGLVIDSNNNQSGITSLVIDASNITAGYTLTVDGTAVTDTESVFTVAGMKVMLYNFTIVGGATAAVDGAAISVGGDVTLNQVTVANTVTAGNGAVAVAANGKLTLDRATFDSNDATNGGAIYNNGGTVSGSATFTNNSADNGGAVYNTASGTVTLEGAMTGNFADNGGAVYNDSGSVTINNGTLDDNDATVGDGGAFYNNGTMTVTNSSISNSDAVGNGGAVYSAAGSVFSSDAATSYNTNSAVDGGAVYSEENITASGIYTNNTATGGAVIHGEKSVEVSGNVSGNNASGDVILADNGDITVNADMVDNTAAAGSVLNAANGSVTVSGGSIRDTTGVLSNSVITATQNVNVGGDITGYNTNDTVISAGGAVTVSGSITGNTAANEVIDAAGAVTISGSVDRNTATNSNLIATTGAVTVSGSINSNTAADDVIEAAGAVTVSGSINNNTAADDVIEADGAVTVSGRMEGNTATDNMIESDGSVTVSGSVRNNEATTGSVISSGNEVAVSGKVDGNTAGDDVIAATGDVTVDGSVNGNTGDDVIRTVFGDVTVSGSANGNTATTGDVVEAGGAVTVSGSMNGNEAQAGTVISSNDAVTVSGKVDGNTAADDVISAFGNVTVDGSVSGNTGDGVISSATGAVTVSGSADGNTATTGDVIGAGGAVTVSGSVSDNVAEAGTVVSSNAAVTVSGEMDGNTAEASVVSAGGDVTVTGSVSGNAATTGDVIGAGGAVTVAGNLDNNRSDSGEVIDAGGNVSITGSVNGNAAATDVVLADGDVSVLNTTLTDNQAGGAVIAATGDVTLVNATMAYNTGDAVNSSGTTKIANSIVMGEVEASDTQAAYSVFSGTPSNMSVNESNALNSNESAIFSGRDSSGNLIVREDSVASMGVWTAYNPDTGDVYYSVRPDIWDQEYTASNMTWKVLGGGEVSYSVVASYLLSDPNTPPSIGNYSYGGSSAGILPDTGPGVNSFMSNSTLSDFDLFGFSASSSLEDGWYSPLYEQLFGRKYDEMGSFSVRNGRGDIGGVPGSEALDISVNGTLDEDFPEFIEEPYYENGTPLTAEELNQIRQAAVTGGVPEESVALQADVDQDVASALKKADLFKDSIDWALDSLLNAKI